MLTRPSARSVLRVKKNSVCKEMSDVLSIFSFRTNKQTLCRLLLVKIVKRVGNQYGVHVGLVTFKLWYGN